MEGVQWMVVSSQERPDRHLAGFSVEPDQSVREEGPSVDDAGEGLHDGGPPTHLPYEQGVLI